MSGRPHHQSCRVGSLIYREARIAAVMVMVVKMAAKIYQVSSSNTSVKAGNWSYTLFTSFTVDSYFF